MSDYPVMHPNSPIYPDIRTFPIAAALLKDAGNRVEHFDPVYNTVRRVTPIHRE